jgi:hypothetical protein
MTPQEIDFAPELFTEEMHDHVILIFSLEGCKECDRLYQDISDAYDLIAREARSPHQPPISVLVRKVDVTAEARSDKAAFTAKMVQSYQYTPRAHGRLLFPLCVYNGRYIGQYKECYGKFCSVMDDYL